LGEREFSYSSLPCSSPFAAAFKLGPLCTLRTWHFASCAAARAPTPSPAVAILRPTCLGLALQRLAQLALRPMHCETRDRHRLAPPRLSAVLEMENQSPTWSTIGADRAGWPDYLLVRPCEGGLELMGLEVKGEKDSVGPRQTRMNCSRTILFYESVSD